MTHRGRTKARYIAYERFEQYSSQKNQLSCGNTWLDAYKISSSCIFFLSFEIELPRKFKYKN